MKLKTLIENLKFYQSKGSDVVTLDINDLLAALDEVPTTKDVVAKQSMAMEVDGGQF
jgi:hypothetical protein|tara:strand:- start:321 stop:491 length:171 start_codon:yes stop_codon:yes gene_type:complete